MDHSIYFEEINVRKGCAVIVVEDLVVVEIKAVINVENIHLAQAKNYVVAYDFSIGLLINFGSTSLQFKKIFNKKYSQNQDKQD